MSTKRGSGRTTRMLEEAKRLEGLGRAVYVVCATPCEIKRLKKLLGDDTSIKVEAWVTIEDHLDLRTLRLKRGHPNCIVLVDHYAIEHRFSALLRELTGYDEV